MDVARTLWQRSVSVEQPFLSLSRSHHVNEVPTTTCLRCHYVHAVLTTPLPCSYCVLIRPFPHYTFLEHVQSLTTFVTSMKTLLRSYCILQVSTTFLLRPTFIYSLSMLHSLIICCFCLSQLFSLVYRIKRANLYSGKLTLFMRAMVYPP